jgi:exopolysaccharide biosynthesis protein
MASENNAIFAVNGDYYGANKRGYVIKNGVLYRDSVRQGDDTEDLVIYSDGSFGIIDETEVSAEALLSDGVVQLFAFGPALLENGETAVSKNDEVDRASSSNPRTAIGIVEPLHYIVVVSDGRTSESEGLTLYELAEVMQQYGCTTAYNLDGGGSSTMVFAGEVVNNPTTNGKKITERAVSDIVYISA